MQNLPPPATPTRGRARTIVSADNPVLKRVARPIKRDELRDPLFLQLLDDGFATIAAYNLIGMAAPQIGVTKRLIFVDFIDAGRRIGPYAIVNPKFELRSGEIISTEGSPCVPNVAAEIVRSAHVICIGLDGYSGNRICLDATGLLAICLQHEVDHLDGKIITDMAQRILTVDEMNARADEGAGSLEPDMQSGSPFLG